MKSMLLKSGLLAAVCFVGFAMAQPPRDERPPRDGERPSQEQDGPRDQRPRGFGGPGGQREDIKLVDKFDTNKDGWLNKEERQPARESLKTLRESREGEGPRDGFGPPRGFGPPGSDRGPGAGPGGNRGGPGGPRGGGNREPASPGPAVSPGDVKPIADAPLYDVSVLRTVFLEFENDDWEMEMQDFHGTDVDVPATLTVDGQKFPNVGVRFRGMSSYGMVPAGHKRSFNVSLDMADKDQRLYGYKTLNLLNSNGDPSYMSTVLYSEIARKYIAAPKANQMRVVVNGESWGVYVNVQQFDKTFLSENYEPSEGTRWKVSGSPGADGGLRYLGDDIEEYKRRFDMNSNDGKKEWAALIELCRTLNETPLDELETALAPMLDIDGALKFLALDVALVNSDGYWTRASDYSLFREKTGMFHLVPHDMNEAFMSGGSRGPGGPGGPGGRGGFGSPPGEGPPPGSGPPGSGREGDSDQQDRGGDRNDRRRPDVDSESNKPRPEQDFRNGPPPEGRDDRGERGPRGDFRGGPGGPGGRGPGGGPGHGSVDLDPLVSVDDPRMPLRSRLLAVPNLRAKYLEYVRQIAEDSLDWERIGTFVAANRELIQPQVALDTRKLDSLQAFENATSAAEASPEGNERQSSLRHFFEQRRKFLLDYKAEVE